MADQQSQPQLSDQEQQHVSALDQHFGAGGAGAADAAAPAAVAPVDVCETWQKIKPYWDTIIKLVKWIPKYGETIAKALQALAAGLDQYCSNQQ